jgi:predicted RNase H-like nuclease (RuvC/YqgF family)
MLRICLIIAILAGLAAGVLTFTKVQDIITTTRADRNKYHKMDDEEVAGHAKTKKKLSDTEKTLATTQKTLESTKGELEAAKTEVDDLTKTKTDLTAKLEKANADKDDAQQQLEQWRLLGLTTEQVKDTVAERDNLKKAKEALISENKLIAAKANYWENRWVSFFNNSEDAVMTAGLRGKIVAVDPKFNFVVLDIGEDQGAKPRGVMMVDRDGKLLGKVRITSVTKDKCVANILPNWQRGNIMEGDEVLY